MRKLFILMLCLMLCLPVLPAGAEEAEAEREIITSGDYDYAVLEDGTAEITKYTGTGKTVVVPSEIDGYKVVSIGNLAFYDRDNLTEITLPDSVMTIGNEAFGSCDMLTEIALPNSLTKVGDNPFVICYNLARIDVSPDHPTLAVVDGVLFDKTENRLICYPSAFAFSAKTYAVPQGTITIGDQAFCHCFRLTEITLPDSVTTIGDQAFYLCSSLTEITLPDSVTTIGNVAFAGCYRLTGITMPDSVTNIGDGAFSGCDRLTEIALPNSLTKVGNNPFYGCGLLTRIDVSPDHPTLAVVDGVLFDKTENRLICYPSAFSAETYAVPQGTITIGNEAFAGCHSLTEIALPNSLTKVGDNPFVDCYNLARIDVSPDHPTLAVVDGVLFDKTENRLICYPSAFSAKTYAVPQGTITIGNEAFGFCSSLTEITLPDSVTTIGNEAFGSCSSLTEIALPNSVTTISALAFHYCSSLTEITLPDSVTSISDLAFSSCDSLTTVTIPSSVGSIGYNVFLDCDNLTNIFVTPGSYAATYCIMNHFPFTYADAAD